MKSLHRLLLNNRSFQGIFVAIFIAFVGSLFIGPHAFAGGPFMGGYTFIQGTDRLTGKTYGNPIFSQNNTPETLHVYPGDKVTFYYYVENVDSTLINMIGVNTFFPVTVKYHTTGWTGNDTTTKTFPPRVINPKYSSFYYSSGSVTTVPDTVTVPSNAKPGSQYCDYVETSPTIVNVLAYVGWGHKVIILNDHSFNTHNEDLAKYVNADDPSLLSLSEFAGIAPPQGDMMSCVVVAGNYNYNLTPYLTVDGGSSGPSGSTNVSTAVTNSPLNNSSNGTDSQLSEWQIEQFYLPSGTTPPNSASTSNQVDPCTYFTNTLKTIQNCGIATIAGGNNQAKSNGFDTVFDTNGQVTSGSQLPVSTSLTNLPNKDGYSVCYVLSVNSYQPYVGKDNKNPNNPPPAMDSWRNSGFVCSAGKKPKVEILGDDVRVGGKIDTSQSNGTINSAENLFGSWGQYASYSVGPSIGFGTSSSFKGGAQLGTQPQALNKLTFANTQAAFGNFSSSVNSIGATTIASLFKSSAQPNSSLGSTITLSDLPGGKTPYLVTNDNGVVNIKGGSDIPKGKTIIIVATGTVDIQGDISYTSDPLSSIGDIPQVIIIAKNIEIDPGVQHIDAWLVADFRSGMLNTCDIAPAQTLTTKICNQQLTVNGPVVTNKLLLNRTFGSDESDPGDPAEIFDNNGVAYLWAQNYLQNNGSLTTTYQTELPPRF